MPVELLALQFPGIGYGLLFRIIDTSNFSGYNNMRCFVGWKFWCNHGVRSKKGQSKCHTWPLLSRQRWLQKRDVFPSTLSCRSLVYCHLMAVTSGLFKKMTCSMHGGSLLATSSLCTKWLLRLSICAWMSGSLIVFKCSFYTYYHFHLKDLVIHIKMTRFS